MKPENSYFTPHFFEESLESKRGVAEVLRRCRQIVRKSDPRRTLRSVQILGRLAAAVFTTTVFLGGSYLFFVQLAEYGW